MKSECKFKQVFLSLSHRRGSFSRTEWDCVCQNRNKRVCWTVLDKTTVRKTQAGNHRQVSARNSRGLGLRSSHRWTPVWSAREDI